MASCIGIGKLVAKYEHMLFYIDLHGRDERCQIMCATKPIAN